MPLSVLKAREEHGEAILGLAGRDVVLNAFIIYDWRELRGTGACDFYVATEGPDGPIEAACAVFHDREFDSVVFCGSQEGIKAMLAELRPRKAVLPRVRPEELGAVVEALGPGVGPIYDALLMTCDEASFRPLIKHRVIKLGPEHAELYRALMAGREDRPTELSLEEARRRLSDPDRPVFAVLHEGGIASVVMLYLSMPEVSLVGGVYTVPELRNKGFATSATAAATREALRRSELAALIVRADNKPAVRVYEKVGYRVHRHLKWVCVGLDYPP